MKHVFADTDIILDMLAKREPFYPFAAELFSLVEKGELAVHISPVIFANLHYILCKLKGKSEAMKSLRKLRLLVKILPVDEKIIDLALTSSFKDFEDAIQYYVAMEHEIAFLLTRNTKDYKATGMTVMTAEEFLDTYCRTIE